MSDKILIQSKLKTYSIEFVNDIFKKVADEPREKSFLIIDSNIYELFRDKINELGMNDNFLVVEATEEHKSYNYCSNIIERLIKKKIRRNHRIVAIGGGIIQDISAFIASILFRGIEWIFIPTTLLAQADSCIGGKTSINFGEIKNTLGNFYPPNKIFIDLNFLSTLPKDDIKSGIGEMLHFYFYSGSAYIDKLFPDYTRLLKHRSLLKEYILESLRIKKSVIEKDEFDKGERNKFNYGHTFGHAIESITNYAIKHGQAVTVGMDLANRISVMQGLIDESLYKSINSRLKVNFPKYDLSDIDIEEYISILSKDKKNIDEQLVCILSEGIGKLVKMKVPMNDEFRITLKTYFRSYRS